MKTTRNIKMELAFCEYASFNSNPGMGKIQPPDYIERLPMNLENNYTHFKATETELQNSC